MAQIFPIDFDEKLTIAQNDFILFSDSEDGNKIKKAQYSNLKGEKGDTGTAATITIGSTTTGTPGSSASVVNSGTTSAAVLDFTIPEGEKGDTGDKGDAATISVGVTTTGEPGTNASVTNSGTTSDAIFNFTIPKGAKGDTGNAATIEVGTTTTLTPGSSATVTNSGTTGAAVFNFGIPKGEKGDTGDTGATGPTGAKINSASFSGDDMVFGLTDSSTVTLTGAKTTLTGPQGETGTAATISVGTTTTGEPGTNASVTNSGTSGAAVFNFTIPKGAKGDTGNTGAAATITVGSTTTGDAGTSATVTNSGTSSAAVLDFTIPKGDKGDTGNTGATGNGIASVTSSKSGKITTVTITETNGDDYSFTVTDGEDGEGSGDVLGPASSVDGHLAVFDGATGKVIKDGGAIPTPTTVVDNLTTQSATSALSANQGYVLDGKISTINGKIPSEATSSNKLADKNYVDDSVNSVTAYYITKNAAGDQFATYAELNAATTFYSGGVVRVPTRNDYCIVLDDENHDHATTRYIYNTNWEYQYTVNETALTQSQMDALNSGITSGKVSSYDSAVSTISGYGDIVTHNASEFATSTQGGKADTALQPNDNITELTNNAGYITSSSLPGKASSSTLGTVKLGSDTVQSVSANAVTGTASRTYATQLNSSDQLVVNVPRTDTTYESKTAASGGTDVSLVTTGEKYTWNNKQNALTTQTAYTTKGTATKVPTITTNTLGQVTAITETNITFPVTSVNGSTGAVSVSEFNPGGTATTGYVLKKTADGYGWDAESGAVTSVNGQTGAVTVSEFTPSGTATTGYVVTKTAGGYEWAEPSGGIGISTDANNILTSGASIWVGTEANYASLATKDSNTIYLTI